MAIILLFSGTAAFAQNGDQLVLTLEQVIDMAQKNSPEAKRVNTVLDNKYWTYRVYKSNYLPQLTLSGSLPDLNRSIRPVTLFDGTQTFVSSTSYSPLADLRLNQSIGATGGSIGIGSSLTRSVINVSGDGASSDQYTAVPASISYTQPLFGFNNLRWDKKIEPMKYEESKREFNEGMEAAAVQAVDRFFSLLIAQKNYEIAEKNLANNDTLFQIATGRYNLGKIAEDDLLQMELTVMNSQNNLSQASLDIQQANLQLGIFLGMTGEEQFSLVPPTEIPQFSVSPDAALKKAVDNRKETIQYDRQLLEAERDVARARGESGLSLDLTASYGLTQNAVLVENAYNSPQDQQRLNVGFSIPVLDWGRAKSQVRTAVANKELTDLNVQQDQLNFKQDILLFVNQFSMSRQQLAVAKKTDEVAAKRYYISKKRYEIGKIDILDLNVALQEKDSAKQGYYSSLQTFWTNYYELRRRTLFDFERMEQLTY